VTAIGSPRPRRIARSAGLIGLFTLSGMTAGGLAFMGAFAFGTFFPGLGLPGIRTTRDVFEACAIGGGLLFLPMLTTAIAMALRIHGDPNVRRWLARSALLAAIMSGGLCLLVLGGLGLFVGFGLGYLERVAAWSAILAASGGVGGACGALATSHLRRRTGERRLASFFD
jgi:hypothetical protein